MVAGPVTGACLNLENDLVEADEVDVIVAAQWPAFVFTGTATRAERDLPLAELDFERVLVEDLKKSGPRPRWTS